MCEEVCAGEVCGGVVVRNRVTCSRVPPSVLQDVHAGVGTCAHSQRVPQPAHLAVPLGPEMASGAFTRRLPLMELFGCLHAVSMRDLITHVRSTARSSILRATPFRIRSLGYGLVARV